MRRQEAVKGEKGVQGAGWGGPSGYLTAPHSGPQTQTPTHCWLLRTSPRWDIPAGPTGPSREESPLLPHAGQGSQWPPGPCQQRTPGPMSLAPSGSWTWPVDTTQSVVTSWLYSPVSHIGAKVQKWTQVTVPREWSLAPLLGRAGGALAHSCLPPSAGSFPGDFLLSEGRRAEPQQGAVCWGQPSPLSADSSQLQLGPPVQAVEDLGAQGSLSKDSP